MTELSLNSQLRITICVLMVASGLFMRWVSLKLDPLGEEESPVGFLGSPLASVITWRKSPPASTANKNTLWAESLLAAVGISAWIYVSQKLLGHFQLRQPWLAYSVIPVLALAGPASSVARLFFLGTGRLIPRVHREPLRSQSLTDFWRRYNVWVSAWLQQVIFRRWQRRPLRALFGVFFVSGVWHELLLTLPLYFLAGVNLLGTMMIYFLLQWAGALIERTMLPEHKILRRAFLWLWVCVPAPLVINETALRLIGLW